ncbi:GntR family transcriptional regulator [Acidisoma silvae]|uniref:GntR family transcriptional regulator n=1 Tax=Acidisoma silvae TaxID=2802396 RepID=A0A964E0F4_9PROT|nr:GntR family transcriptional regulator [Acidisoma silvae]MCB8877112.1 GntR family transcriptional regulator [Acidisoma silvae]
MTSDQTDARLSPPGKVKTASGAALENGQAPLIRRLLSYIVTEDLPAGAHLTEQGLADALQVSRTPVRRALMDLHAEGLVEKHAHRGYFLTRPARALFVASLDFPAFDEDTLFERVATDHLRGTLPKTFSEQDVIAEYGVSARLARRVIETLSEERVIVSGKSGAWEFNPFLLTNDASLASYAYRLATEPQIPLLPTFAVRRDLIRACRDEHIRLLSLPAQERTARLAFKVDAGFHETVALCGGNPFFHSGVTQHNRLRQLLEYRDAPDEGRVLVWLKEHLDIMEAVVVGDLAEASALMRKHLTNAMRHRQDDPLLTASRHR